MASDNEPATLGGSWDAAFCAEARHYGLDPADPWVGGYVGYEWRHARHYIRAFLGSLGKQRVLEFGCNVGATAIVLARLGGEVYAVDVAPKWLALARRNAQRFGEHVRLIQIGTTGGLPFADEAFDSVVCNSVLEYLDHGRRAQIIAEIDRVLKSGGIFLVLGTSNRLWPREVHSARWFSNYFPARFDRILGSRQRGILPWAITRQLASYQDLVTADRGLRFLDARGEQEGSFPKRLVARGLVRVASLIGQPPGAFLPSFLLALRKC